jgi:hypothetical protein
MVCALMFNKETIITLQARQYAPKRNDPDSLPVVNKGRK